MKGLTGLIGLVGSVCLASLLTGCPGGGEDGGAAPAPVATPAPTMVSGNVQAPAGQIAFYRESSIGELFVSAAYAALTGLAPVPDNTIVQLARLNATASSFNVITTTTTSGGRYALDLTALGLQPANDLIVRVAGQGGKEMRAFVVGTTADLSPVSEAAYQLAIQSLGGGPLANLTLQEVADIVGSVGLIAALQNVGTATSIDQAASLVRTAVGANAQVMAFLTAAAAPGQTPSGAGDVGNFFPFETGSVWTYSGRRTSEGSSINYENTVTVTGQGPVPGHGVIGTIFSETNDEGENRPETTYGVKELAGIRAYGNDDSNDHITRQLVPFQVVHFPLSVGVTTLLAERSGLDWGEDEDGDGRNETFSAKLFQTVVGTEQISVQTGTFSNALRIEQKAVFVVNFTRGGSGTAIQEGNVWHAPGIGKVKEIVEARVEGGPVQATLSEALSFYSVNGASGGGGTPPPPPPPPPAPTRIEISPPQGSGTAVFLNQSKQLGAIAYGAFNDQFPGLIYTWQSSDPAIVDVDSTGMIMGRAPGRATITAFSNGLTSNALIFTVNNGRLLSLSTNDLAYDKISQKFFASIRSDAPSNQDTVTVIDPATGNVGPFVPVGLQPNKVAISGDGQYLYVGLDGAGSFRRVQLPSLLPGPTVSLGTGDMGGGACPTAPLLVDDMQVLPGLPLSVVISRKYSGFCSPWYHGVAVFDNGVQRSAVTHGPLAEILETSESASTVYGLDGESSGSTFSTITLNSTGSSTPKETLRPFLDLDIRKDMVLEGGKIYTNDGEVLDPITHQSLGRYPRPENMILSSVRPDPILNRVFFVGRATTGILYLIAYEKTTLQLLGTEEIDLANDGRNCESGLSSRTALYRWSTNGVAFRTGGCHLVLLQSTLVQ